MQSKTELSKKETRNAVINITKVNVSKNKPKKRNQSVRFMLDDTETVVIEISNSEISITDSKIAQNNNSKVLKTKRPKKKSKDGKENKVEINTSGNKNKDPSKDSVQSDKTQIADVNGIPSNENQNKLDIKKKRRQKKLRDKQIKIQVEDEPATKITKKDIKPDVIAQDLENLSIGDNAHTLTNLLDEMTVVDKKKHRKPKRQKQSVSDVVSADVGETENVEENKTVKWIKRKWIKDMKGGVDDDKLITSIVIENLPLKIMCNYKMLLTQHFTKFGTIKLIGAADVYPIEHPKAFTTTINFESEDAANKALEDDNTLFEDNRLRITRLLPPTQTTLFVRSYADLSESALNSVFTCAGQIRKVRRLVKGRKCMCTAFIEFDGPEAVERAIKMAKDVKICGIKIFAGKYESPNKNKKLKTDKKNENDGVSEDSND